MENSKIEWTDHTFNPWSGCIKVSPGCVHCYAETLSNRWGKDVWGPGAKRQRTSAANWKKPLQWNKQAKELGVRYKVFCASMADVFEDNSQLDPWRIDLLHLIEDTPRLDWLLLTKRPENVNRMIERATGFSDSGMWFHAAPHVQVGTSIENQEYADIRIPELLNIPASIRFLSIEPLLGPVCLDAPQDNWLAEFTDEEMRSSSPIRPPQIHWVIVGGESGPGARPMHPNWARSLRDQCQAAGVAFFFKQWGNWIPKTETHCWDDEDGWRPKSDWSDALKAYWFSKKGKWGCLSINGKYSEDTTTWNGRQNDPRDDYEVTVYEVGKKVAGRLLDGRTWGEFPKGVNL